MREAQDSSKRFYHAGRDRYGFVCIDDATPACDGPTSSPTATAH